jgi:DNA-3-methyladenine glycosylase I
MIKRCDWVPDDDLYKRYHDDEWGVPVYEDQLLFEYLILEGAQAGLSWSTILKKRENYRLAFDLFDAKKISKYGDKKIEELLNNPGIVRNKLKIGSTIRNAKIFLEIQKEHGSFREYIWSFVDGKPIVNRFQELKDIPAKSEISDNMSKDLKKRGFNFVGSTICYAFMQAVGMVNDHTVDCFRYKQVNSL